MCGAAAVLLSLTDVAAASETVVSSGLSIRDGRTQPVFDYADAVREVVYIDVPVDTDGDGESDRIAMRITRPRPTEQGLKVASIVQASPYYGGGWDNPDLQWHPDDVVDEPQLASWQPPTGPWPGWTEGHVYNDNYFVPRGYAVVKVAALGTWASSGCPVIGNADDKRSMKAVVDFLAGRIKGYAEDGREVTADWSTGDVAMTGKSHEGSLPIMAAATGVPGLRTIVSIQGVANWYDTVRRNGGVVHSPTFPGDDIDMTAKVIVSRRDPAACEAEIRRMSQDMDRQTGDYNEFWAARNSLGDVRAFPPTFLIAGLRDQSVTPKHFADQWAALGRHRIPRKAWIMQAGHDDPLYVAEQRWLDEVHAWYDHWLYGIDNGVTERPAVDVETAPGVWRTQSTWPAPDAKPVRMSLKAGDGTGQPGVLSREGAGSGSQGFVDASKRPTADKLGDLSGGDDSRLLYVSPPLATDQHLSGTPKIQVRARLSGAAPYLTGYLIDLGPDTRVTGFAPTAESWCFGPSLDGDSGCRSRWAYQSGLTPYHVVSRGWQDVRNRISDRTTTPVDPSTSNVYRWDLEPSDHVFKAGHRIAVVVMATDYEHTLRYPTGTQVTVDLAGSGVTLPLTPSDG
ncbi:X-Pro dipeptidyl-peptidase [Micromonospora andamanensis]|uniref:Xaa-Pro dipeptidyl-peptidase n=1 Tax=Micromonospora andamanensis TaxID=1287068 RepID=A0ABQ4I231_9ACTN|nr:X-Pro dipeptidyl-peptidase [Micromonospora andamanensis]